MLEEGRSSKSEIPQTALDLAEELKTLETMNDGTADVPYYGIDPVAVTAENMDEVIIGSDFHTYDDVYLNVKK